MTEMQKEDTPLVTIITVVLNGEDEIEKTIDSVVEQQYEMLEYLIIDGGSSDGTLEKIAAYADRRIILTSEKDNGISDAFNKGIARAKGEIIGIINAGDWYEQRTVDRVVETFQGNREVSVVCGDVLYWHGQEKGYRCTSRPELLAKEMSVTHPSCFLRKSLYLSCGPFDTDFRFAMDYELLLRCKVQGAVFTVLPEILANMQHGGVSEENWKRSLKETHRARKKHLTSSFFTSDLYLTYLIKKRGLRKLMERIGMEGLVRFYRQHLALVKKVKEE